MIDKGEFTAVWKHLSARFRQKHDPHQAVAYFEFLNEQMDTAEFVAAARVIWATSRFFPRPADFLALQAGSEWPLVLRAVGEYTPPHGKWFEHYRQLSPRSVDACERLGGMGAMRTIYERDPLRLKTEWERAYEQATTAAVLSLPPSDRKWLRPAS